MQSLISTADIETRFSSYAYPLLFTFRRASDTPADDLGLMETRLKDTFEVTLKYMALSLVAKYKSDGLHFPEIDDQIKKLKRPSLGMYSSLLRDLLGVYSQLDDPFTEALRRFYEDSLDEKTFEVLRDLSSKVDVKTPSNTRDFKQLLDVLVAYRNKIAGHGAASQRGEVEARVAALSHLVATLFEGLRYLAELRLVRVLSVEKSRGTQIQRLQIWNGLLPRRQETDAVAGLVPDRLYLEVARREGAVYLDLTPFGTALECESCGSDQVAFLNEAKKSKLEFLSYQCGHKLVVASGHWAFEELKRGVETLGPLQGEDTDLPPWLREKLEISEESRTHRHKARASIAEGDVEEAINFLRVALRKSPGYRQAVLELADLLEDHGRQPEALKTVDSFLDLVRDDVELLVRSARLSSGTGLVKQCEARIREIAALEPDNEEAKRLREDVRESEPESGHEDDVISRSLVDSLLLPWEFLSLAIFGTRRHLGKMMALGLIAATGLGYALFYTGGDGIMALTLCSMGVLFATSLWATFRIRKLLILSRPNFAAFLQTSLGDGEGRAFSEMVIPVFGRYPEADHGIHALLEVLKLNWRRALLVLAGAGIGTAWIFRVSKYSAEGWTVNFFFGVFSFLLFVSCCYLVSCIFEFHRLLRNLRFQSIHFSLVQHPKLSIRYLSHLSRRVSYPLILVYIVAILTLYLGPFLANLAFVGVLTAFVLLICFLYYSTIFIVRGVILQNKWRLISRFSVHFDTPFNRLIDRADPADMKRLRELLEMRDFIDSMDVWAEKKSVLLAASSLYLGVILFAIVGLSHSMTRWVVPALAESTHTASLSDREENIALAPDRTDPADVEIRVRDVDDSVLVFWGDTLDAVLGLTGRLEEMLAETEYRDQEVGYARADWANGAHGEMSPRIPLTRDRVILVVGYNKVFHGIFWMGGGKFSQDVRVLVAGQPVLTSKRFVRQNDRGVKYVALIDVAVEGDVATAKINEIALPPTVDVFLTRLEAELKKEEDARPEFFSGN